MPSKEDGHNCVGMKDGKPAMSVFDDLEDNGALTMQVIIDFDNNVAIQFPVSYCPMCGGKSPVPAFDSTHDGSN